MIIHGKSHTPIHKSWTNMKSRCFNKNVPAFKNYGARGITVCDRWLSFINFLEDMGGDFKEGLELDRIDNNKEYSPENCKWATPTEQNRNKRNSRFITFDGKTLCLSEWAEILQIPSGTLHARLKYGWSLDRAASEPVGSYYKNTERKQLVKMS